MNGVQFVAQRWRQALSDPMVCGRQLVVSAKVGMQVVRWGGSTPRASTLILFAIPIFDSNF
jgi:hypothetical protein